MLFGLANAEFKRGRIVEAEATYRKLLDIDNDHVAARNNLAWLLADQGRFVEAQRAIAEALRLNKEPALEDELRDTASRIQRRAGEARTDETQ